MKITRKLANAFRQLTRPVMLITAIAFGFQANGFAQSKLTKGDHFAEVNGFRMHYVVRGKGPICILPSAGWGIPIEYIMPLDAFEKHFTMVYFDTRLSGQSDGPTDSTRYSADDYTNDIDSLRSYLGQDKIWLAGHSMGGYQALYYAINHNERLNGLIVMGSIVTFDSLRSAQYKKLLTQRKDYPYYVKHPDIYKKATDIMLTGKDTTHHSMAETFRLTGCLYTHDGAIGNTFFNKLNFRPTVGDYIGVSHFYSKKLLPDLHKITVPTLAMCGDDDFICDNVSQSNRIHTEIKQSKLAIIKDCGHILWAEQPKAFAKESETFFKENGL